MRTPIRISDCRVTRAIALCLGPCLLGSPLGAAEEAAPPAAGDKDKPAADEKAAPEKTASDASELKNWIEVGVGGVFLDGDTGQFMQRHRMPKSAFGGVEGFHWEQAVSTNGLLKVDGRGLFDLHDYELKLDMTWEEKGFVRAGYKEFRSWYDGSGGGYLPLTGAWFDLYDDTLHVDRGEAWFEAGLRVPNVPFVTFKYSHQFRRGTKDSTAWGDHSFTGSNNGLDQRGIVPSFWDIDEVRDIFELNASHTIKKTDLNLGLRYEMSNLDNALKIHRRPGEPAADRYVTSRTGNGLDLFSVHGSSLTRFNDKLVFTAGASFTTLENDLSGQRFYGAGYDMGYDLTSAGRRQVGDQGYTNLDGGSRVDEYVVNLNLMYNPWEYLSIVPSLRVQQQDTEGSSTYLDTMDTLGGTLPSVASYANTDRGLLSVSERLDLRYSAITNWVFYGRAEWSQDQGDLAESYSGRVAGAILPNPNFTSRQTDYDRFSQKYTVGANWYPMRRLNFAVQYYHKIRDNDYDHSQIVRPPTFLLQRYPGFITHQEFDTDDVNARVTWRPLNNVTLVSRYDFQLSTIQTRGQGFAEIQSGEVTSHLFGESLTWVPFSRFYVQAGANLALDRAETPAQDLTGAQSSLVPESQNNYWSGNLLVGYAFTAKTDLQANYLYYRANNFVDNSKVSVPYGADAQEHGITATVIHRLNDRTRWNLKYGYFNYREDAAGGYNDYDAHMIYTGVQYLF